MQQREYGLALIYAALGAVGLIGGLSYPIGTFSRMGPGFLPVSVSLIILAFSGVSFVRGFAKGEALRPQIGMASLPQAKSIVLLLGAMVLFAFTCRSLGLFPAVVLLMLVGATSSVDFKLSSRPVVGLLAIGFAFSFVFVRLLGIPLPLMRLPF